MLRYYTIIIPEKYVNRNFKILNLKEKKANKQEKQRKFEQNTGTGPGRGFRFGQITILPVIWTDRPEQTL